MLPTQIPPFFLAQVCARGSTQLRRSLGYPRSENTHPIPPHTISEMLCAPFTLYRHHFPTQIDGIGVKVSLTLAGMAWTSHPFSSSVHPHLYFVQTHDFCDISKAGPLWGGVWLNRGPLSLILYFNTLALFHILLPVLFI